VVAAAVPAIPTAATVVPRLPTAAPRVGPSLQRGSGAQPYGFSLSEVCGGHWRASCSSALLGMIGGMAALHLVYQKSREKNNNEN
jgi:hypothetical protein